jgi:hypothetical protein
MIGLPTTIFDLCSTCVGAEVTTRVVTLEDMMGKDTFRKAGLQKLSDAEQLVLTEWINDYMNTLLKSVEEDCRRGLIK